MAVSQTTSLSRITRRSALAGCVVISTISDGLSRADRWNADPIGPLWTEWKSQHQQAAGLCHKVQDLEAQLLKTVGSPFVTVPRAGGTDGAVAHSHDEIDALLEGGSTHPEVAEELHRKLTNLEERWSAEAALLGFDAAMQQESDAWAQEAEAAKAIFSTSATSLPGVQIKLAFMIETCSVGPPDVVTLLPQLQSAFADVAKLIAASSGRR